MFTKNTETTTEYTKITVTPSDRPFTVDPRRSIPDHVVAYTTMDDVRFVLANSELPEIIEDLKAHQDEYYLGVHFLDCLRPWFVIHTEPDIMCDMSEVNRLLYGYLSSFNLKTIIIDGTYTIVKDNTLEVAKDVLREHYPEEEELERLATLVSDAYSYSVELSAYTTESQLEHSCDTGKGKGTVEVYNSCTVHAGTKDKVLNTYAFAFDDKTFIGYEPHIAETMYQYLRDIISVSKMNEVEVSMINQLLQEVIFDVVVSTREEIPTVSVGDPIGILRGEPYPLYVKRVTEMSKFDTVETDEAFDYPLVGEYAFAREVDGTYTKVDVYQGLVVNGEVVEDDLTDFKVDHKHTVLEKLRVLGKVSASDNGVKLLVKYEEEDGIIRKVVPLEPASVEHTYNTIKNSLFDIPDSAIPVLTALFAGIQVSDPDRLIEYLEANNIVHMHNGECVTELTISDFEATPDDVRIEVKESDISFDVDYKNKMCYSVEQHYTDISTRTVSIDMFTKESDTVVEEVEELEEVVIETSTKDAIAQVDIGSSSDKQITMLINKSNITYYCSDDPLYYTFGQLKAAIKAIASSDLKDAAKKLWADRLDSYIALINYELSETSITDSDRTNYRLHATKGSIGSSIKAPYVVLQTKVAPKKMLINLNNKYTAKAIRKANQ